MPNGQILRFECLKEEQEAELGQTMEKAAREILAEEAAKAAKTDRMLDKKLDHIEIVYVCCLFSCLRARSELC